MATMTPRGARTLAREQRKQSLPPAPRSKRIAKAVQTITSPAAPPPTLDFFGLPIELRDMVYDQLWRSKTRVTAHHKSTATGIWVGYDVTVFDESELDLESATQGPYWVWSRDWHSRYSVGLPMWLLTNKQFLDEGMQQFRLKAHFKLWFVAPCYAHNLVLTRIMSPKYATRLSLECSNLSLVEHHSFNFWSQSNGIVPFEFSGCEAA